jgi:Cu-Zn family superoxide dismutase
MKSVGGNRSSSLRKWATLGLGALLLPACATHNGPTIYDDPSAIAVLLATSGSSVHGVVTFVRMADVTLVNANFSGFKPNSRHRIQISERGDCTARDASSAGEPFSPASSTRGSPPATQRNNTDVGNIRADAKGEAYETFEMADGAFGTGEDSIIGRGLIVQAGRGDVNSPPATQPAARQACGVITRNADRTTYAKTAR